MSFRVRVLPLIGLLLLLILYGPPSVPGTAPCSQVATFGQYGLLGFLLPSAAACPGPQFTVTANPSSLVINPGSTGTSTISLTSIDSFSGTVSLSTSVFCLSLGCSSWSVSPTSVNLTPNGTATSILTILAGNSWPAPGSSLNVTIYAASGNLTRSAIVKFTTSPDFTISANPSTQKVQPGATATSTILLTSIGGFSGTVGLTTPLVPCFTYCWSINPTSVNLSAGGNASSTLSIPTTSGISPGNYSIAIGAHSSSLSHQVIVYFTVVPPPGPDFGMTANPNSLQIQVGSSGTSTISVSSLNGFSGNLALQTSAPALCPGCTTWSIYPSSVTLFSNGTAKSTLTILAGAIRTSENVNVTATSGGLSHTVTVTFAITSGGPPDFSMSANPSSLNIAPGANGTSTIKLTSVNGFSGNVSLATSSPPLIPCPPSCSSWSISPTTVKLAAGGTASAVLTIVVGSFGGGGSGSTIAVSGKSGNLTHSVNVQFTVISPNFTTSANPGNFTIDQGSSGTITINVTSINGFAGTVSLTAAISPAGPTANLNPSSITLQGGGTHNSILTISTTASTPAGSYTITVTATGGSISRSVTIGITVLDPPASGGGGGGGIRRAF